VITVILLVSFFAAGFVFWYWEHRRERAAQAACTGH
jgi:DHA1 family bicyclomycin/chloramphenicol resistance-like MFS transporter